MTTRRSLLALGAVAITAASIAGCGGSSTTEGASTASTSAREAAADTPTTCPELKRSRTQPLMFINTTPEAITLRTEPGWDCGSPNAGFSGVSTPASLNGLQVPPGGSVTRPLEIVYSNSGWSNRFALSFYSGSDRPQIMPITPTGNVMRFVDTGARVTSHKGWYVMKTATGTTAVCDISFPTALSDGTQATVTFDSYRVGCGGKTPEITFSVK